MNEYLTIKEFATAASVSVQAVYQRLGKDLKPYLKTIKGKKCLYSEGLQLFIKDDSSEIKQGLNKNALNDFKTSTEIAEISLLNDTLNAFKEQLTVKDKQIEELQAALRASQEQQAALTAALTAQQALHAGDIQRQLIEQSEQPERVPEREPEIVPREQEPERRSLWKRIFRR